jgi:hypothetical protein
MFFSDVPEMVEREAQLALTGHVRPSTGASIVIAATSAVVKQPVPSVSKALVAPESATVDRKTIKSRDTSPVNHSRTEFPSYLSSNVSKSVTTESMSALVAKLHKFSG